MKELEQPAIVDPNGVPSDERNKRRVKLYLLLDPVEYRAAQMAARYLGLQSVEALGAHAFEELLKTFVTMLKEGSEAGPNAPPGEDVSGQN